LKTFMPFDHAEETPRRQGLAKPAGPWQRPAMKRFAAAVIFTLIGAGMARAETILTLSATGTAVTMPDQMTASLDVQATAPTAAVAQAKVNKAMAKALADARAVNGVTATTESYSVQQTDADDSQKPVFQASQTLNLTMPAPGATPPAAFTNLVGALQQEGLLLNTLDGQLSAAGADAASKQATVDALHRLRAQADAIAATLGDKVGEIKTISIDANNPGPVMPGRMLMMAAAAPPPQAAPGPVTIQVTASATIILTPLGP